VTVRETPSVTDEALKTIQHDIAKADLRLKELEIRYRTGPWRALFKSPILIGAFITGYIAFVSSSLTSMNASRQMKVDAGNLELEQRKFQSSLVLDAIQTGDHRQAAGLSPKCWAAPGPKWKTPALCESGSKLGGEPSRSAATVCSTSGEPSG